MDAVQADLDMREAARLAALDRYDFLDTPREASFDRIVRLIRTILDIPVAIVSVIDAHRQWYKACEGLGGSEAGRRNTFCRYTILQDEPLVVPDARLDPRFAENPYVVGDPHVCSYAGVPLRTSDGHNIGSVCAIGFEPRDFSEKELGILADFAAMAMNEIELRQRVSTDMLTGILSRRAFMEVARRDVALAQRQYGNVALIAFDIDHFKSINDTLGHGAGDTMLQSVAEHCANTLRETDIFGRIGGEEFALLAHAGRNGAFETAERLRTTIERMRVQHGDITLQATASFGIAMLDPSAPNLEALIERADAAMYQSKQAGRNRCTLWHSADAHASRRRVLKAGSIIFNNRSSTIDCTVRGIGEDGATLDVFSAVGIPNRFQLAIASDRFEAQCRILSQQEKRLEVAFV
jgi:diguanylate cyclase (GGDEF)-like protein